MKALWTEAEAKFDGQFWQLDGVPMSPKPVQKPHPPLWFGGRHPSGLRRTARLADGWMGAGSTTTEQFKEHVIALRNELEERGRDPDAFPISKRVYLAIDPDRDRAEGRIAEWGDHDTLVSRGGLYAEIDERQRLAAELEAL